jgi:hypothetical protein
MVSAQLGGELEVVVVGDLVGLVGETVAEAEAVVGVMPPSACSSADVHAPTAPSAMRPSAATRGRRVTS